MLFFLVFAFGLAGAIWIPVWWSFVPVVFLAAFFTDKGPRHSFWSGFFAMALVWVSLILQRSIPNGNILARKMAGYFSLPHWTFLLALALLVSGGIGGLSGYCGYLIRQRLRLSPR
jgi:hypothetical protein